MVSGRTFWQVGVLALLATAACSKSSDDDVHGSGASSGAPGSAGHVGAAGKAAAGSGGTSGTSSGPPITSAPPAWAPPADCGGVGNLCPNLSGCDTESVCQLEGNVCIPKLTGTSLPGRTAETPYCAAYTCMTFEQASCFCTGPAGKTVPACSSPAALAGLCAGQGQGCSGKTCCDGLACTDNGSKSSLCQQKCSAGSECSTGCCTDLYDTGVTICAAADACANPCRKRGEACQPGSETTPNNCCRGTCLESDNPDYAGCRPYCNTNADCSDTGCCVPFSNASNGFCADARYCSCGGVDATCGPNDPACCDGNVCAGTDASGTSFKCYKGCKVASDCPNDDCELLADNSTSICLSTANDCAALGAQCGSDVSCCHGTTCAGFEGGGFTCFKKCTTDADCNGGTCRPVGTTDHACYPN